MCDGGQADHAARAASPPIPDLSARVPPDHTRIRKLVQGCFGPRRFKAIEPQIREIVTRAIDGIIG